MSFTTMYALGQCRLPLDDRLAALQSQFILDINSWNSSEQNPFRGETPEGALLMKADALSDMIEAFVQGESGVEPVLQNQTARGAKLYARLARSININGKHRIPTNYRAVESLRASVAEAENRQRAVLPSARQRKSPFFCLNL